MSGNQHQNSHIDPNIAYHVEWGFRREAFVWLDNRHNRDRIKNKLYI